MISHQGNLGSENFGEKFQVGAPGDNDRGDFSGAAYVFLRKADSFMEQVGVWTCNVFEAASLIFCVFVDWFIGFFVVLPKTISYISCLFYPRQMRFCRFLPPTKTLVCLVFKHQVILPPIGLSDLQAKLTADDGFRDSYFGQDVFRLKSGPKLC